MPERQKTDRKSQSNTGAFLKFWLKLFSLWISLIAFQTPCKRTTELTLICVLSFLRNKSIWLFLVRPHRRPPILHWEVVQVSCWGEELGRLAFHAGGPYATSWWRPVGCKHGNTVEECQQAKAGWLWPATVCMADSERVPLSGSHSWDGHATLWPWPVR